MIFAWHEGHSIFLPAIESSTLKFWLQFGQLNLNSIMVLRARTLTKPRRNAKPWLQAISARPDGRRGGFPSPSAHVKLRPPLNSPTPNHYARLGLDRNCSPGQIREAYRILAKRFHPDMNGGSADSVQQTQELNLAYEILSDPARRASYDAALEEAGRQVKPVRSSRPVRHVNQDVLLRVDELLRGTRLEVRVDDPGNPAGLEIYSLEIPAATAPGTRLRIARDESAGGGWVNVRVKARPDARFKVRGSDVRCDLRIHARRAAEGGWETVRGPLGNYLRVEIPRKVARGEVIRIEGEGLPKSRGGRGDLLVRVMYQPVVQIRRSRR